MDTNEFGYFLVQRRQRVGSPGPDAVPSDAILDQDSIPILDESGNYILGTS